MTSNRLLGFIGVVWGGALLLGRLLSGARLSAGVYGAGQAAWLVFASLRLIVGAYYLFKEPVPK